MSDQLDPVDLQNSNLSHFFVYGTLKSKQCRESCWGESPLQIQPAWTVGELYDLGPYPGMLHGQDRVLGEVWTFPRSLATQVRQTLDAIEITDQPGVPNLYNREVIPVEALDGKSFRAQAYFYAQSSQIRDHASRLYPDQTIQGNSYAVWPPRSYDS